MVNVNEETLKSLKMNPFPVLDNSAGDLMKNAVLKAKGEKDSLGGIIESAVINLPAGIGEPFFDSMESTLAQLLFSIPGVKGVEFGAGFDITKMKGSEANDEYYMDGDKVKPHSNNNGGILGGNTNGMPVIYRVAIKPTPSIGRAQRTVNIEKKENDILEIKGRHDPCIVPRALVVVEAVTAMALLDNIE